MSDQTRDRPLSFHWRTIDDEWSKRLNLPDPRSTERGKARASILIEAVIAAKYEGGRAVSYSRRREFYAGKGRYHGTAYTYSTVTSSVDELAELGLIASIKAEAGTRGRQSTFRATDHLLSTVTLPAVVYAPHELIRLKDGDGRLIDYRDTAATERWRDELEAFNEAITTARVDLAAPDVVHDGPVIRRGDRVLYPAMNKLYRVFNNGRFTEGGRFYGAWWQNASKIDRAQIHIEGEQTCEKDYRHLHPRLLYARAGKTLVGDAYTLDGWPRDLVKIAFNITINAETYEAARGAVANELRDKGIEGAHQKAAKLIEAVKQRHADIAQFIHTSIGLRLQRTDSDIASEVMQTLLRDNVVVLPVHDSFIVQAQHEGRLQEVMQVALARIVSPDRQMASTSSDASVPHMAPCAPPLVILLPSSRLQLDLFPSSSPSVLPADLSWSRGVAPSSVRAALRHAIRQCGLRQDELAPLVGVSRPQLTNILRGRFGTSAATAAALKAFIAART